MPEGTIARFFPGRSFGFIEQDAGGKDLFFHISSVQGLADHELVPGTRVYYESESSQRGPRARVVCPAGAAVASGPGERPAAGYRFLNPYNFVRPVKVRTPDAAPLLGRCSPPPHDRYLGLSGQIACKLTAVTPIFVADADDVEEGPRDHYHFNFFRYDSRTPAIPATSLRGAIRSVFEAATNSCFSVFAGYKRLSYHLRPEEALKLVPARVVREDDGWYLELLTGTTPLAVGQKPQGPQYAAWVHAYRPLWASRTIKRAPNTPYAQRRHLSLAGWEHGQPCQAIIEEIEHPLRHFHFWNVVELDRPGAPPLEPGPGQRRVTGYLCITNQNIENKHDERLFFHADKTPRRIPLVKEVRDRYEALIADYQERHADAVGKRKRRKKKPEQPDGKDPAFSWFVFERIGEKTSKLCDEDLVYAMLRREGRETHLDFIVPVSVPRVGYDQLVRDRLDPDVGREKSNPHKCWQYHALCPACRTFGWVWGTGDPDEKPPSDESVPIAYAGRVRFSHARLTHSAGTFEATLAILSSPKPTTTRFYLRPRNEREPIRDGQEDQEVDYAADRQLRGRKFYRHHGKQLSEQEYRRAGDKPDDQNRTVKGVQQAGSTFEFAVDFENLTQVELGALLWALEMEGWHHRIGMGKPLGFGSATVEIVKLQTLNPGARYRSLDAGWDDALGKRSQYVDAFQKAMAARYGSDFDDLDNIRDLHALLAESPDLPVHYPRPTVESHPEGRNYEWFVGNKRSGRDAGPRLTLPLAEDDDVGLPLIDKYGKAVR